MKTLALMLFVSAAQAASTTTAAVPIQSCPESVKYTRCTDRSLLGRNQDGKLCLAGDLEAVAGKVMDLFSDLKERMRVLELQNELLTKEILRVRAEKK